MVTKKVLVLMCLLICGEEVTSQSLPNQVQQFLQQSFFNPIREKVHDGIQGLADALAPPSDNSSTKESLPTSSPVPTEFPLRNVGDSSPFENETQAYPDSSPSSTTVISSSSTETQLLSNSSSVSRSGDQNATKSVGALKDTAYFLSPDSLEEIKELCSEQLTRLEDDNIAKHWRYHAPSGNCSKIGLKGPCGNDMTFYIEKIGSINGTCDCRTTKRTFIYHELTNSCYGIFTQGYCNEGEWLDLTRENKPVCKPNPCATPGKDMVKVEEKCLEVNTHNCAEKTYQVGFKLNQRTPGCFPPLLQSVGVTTVPCSAGNSLAIHGKCHVSDWEFGDDGTGGEDDKDSEDSKG